MGINALIDMNNTVMNNCKYPHSNKNMNTNMFAKENNKQLFHQTSTPQTIQKTKDFVGNNKEFRMEQNTCNLRFIGNGNCIRIAHNLGNLQVIGNNTRLKIIVNTGHIKYTGNDGRVCLGSESTQQTVDYVGCNGVLKVVNATQLNQTKAKSSKKNQRVPKSASFDGLSSESDDPWQQFSERFHRKETMSTLNISLPDLKEANNCHCHQSEGRPVKHIDTIIVQNSVNVSL